MKIISYGNLQCAQFAADQPYRHWEQLAKCSPPSHRVYQSFPSPMIQLAVMFPCCSDAVHRERLPLRLSHQRSCECDKSRWGDNGRQLYGRCRWFVAKLSRRFPPSTRRDSSANLSLLPSCCGLRCWFSSTPSNCPTHLCLHRKSSVEEREWFPESRRSYEPQDNFGSRQLHPSPFHPVRWCGCKPSCCRSELEPRFWLARGSGRESRCEPGGSIPSRGCWPRAKPYWDMGSSLSEIELNLPSCQWPRWPQGNRELVCILLRSCELRIRRSTKEDATCLAECRAIPRWASDVRALKTDRLAAAATLLPAIATRSRRALTTMACLASESGRRNCWLSRVRLGRGSLPR